MTIQADAQRSHDSTDELEIDAHVDAASESDELWSLMQSLPATHPARAEARNSLVAMHLPLVNYLSRRYANRGEPIEDLTQVGAVGLLKAIDRFEPERGLAFSTFATPTILGEIKRHFRDRAWMVRPPRSLQELRVHIARAREELSQQLDRSPTTAELAQFMDVGEDEVIEGIAAASGYSAVSIDAPTDDGTSSVGSMIEQRLGGLDEGMELVERRQCVAPLLDELPERDRQIIFLRFFREMTQMEIADELGISQMHVSRLLTQILAKLQAKLAEDTRSAA